MTMDGTAEHVDERERLEAPHSVPGEAASSGPVASRTRAVSSSQESVPQGARFETLEFSGPTGSRRYKLYVPSGHRSDVRVPLVVMLHGCTQSPNDFAAGTRMNEAAEANDFLVAYPEQTAADNMRKCWNWFVDGNQRRDSGEPAIIAGITREIVGVHGIDPLRVYVAGLSAGGAMAAIMGHAYRDLYAAIGVHSGLAKGAARDMASAFSAMLQGAKGEKSNGHQVGVAAIVFHGDRDWTVNVRNGDAVAAQSSGGSILKSDSEAGSVSGGRSYTRTVSRDASGRSVVEQWVVHGAAHAWAGGSDEGSYTDPRGPDATSEMVRFFLEHPKPT